MSGHCTHKILFVLPSLLGIGGACRSARRLTVALREQGHEVWVLFPDHDLFPGVRHQEDFSWSFHLEGGMQAFSTEVVRAIDHIKPDFLVGWYGSIGGVAAVSAAKLRSLPVVVALRGNDIDLDFFLPERHGLISWVISNATAITTVSTEMKHKVQSWFGREATFISNSVNREIFFKDVEATEVFRARYISSSKPVLGLFGEFKPKRGLELLSRIYDEIEHWQPLIVGKIRDNVAHLIPPHAIKVPYLRDDAQLRGAYGVCDVVIQPSLYDGMPNVVLEALACKKIVLSSAAGGLSDLSSQDENAFICHTSSEWKALLQKVRARDLEERPVCLPTPEEEAQAYRRIFDQIKSS